MPIEQRENAQILGSSRCLLGTNHVVEISNNDLDAGDTDSMRIALELGVSGDNSGWRKRDVELAVIADEIPCLHGSQ